MAAVDPKLILNEELPPDLRKELTEDARVRNLTMNDAATRILCEHFGVEWKPSNRSFREAPKRFKLRVSEDLHRELRVHAANKLQTIRGVTLNVLTTHYNTDIIEPTRRARRVA